jgi:hypothetical protein
MATFNKYDCFVQDVGRKVHDLNSDVLKVALTNTAPNASTHTVLADITEISAGNGYSAGGTAIASSSYAQSAGVAKLAGNDVVFTASGGSVGPFRYAVIYNSTAASGPLIGWHDYGSSISLADGESFTDNFADNTNLLQIS